MSVVKFTGRPASIAIMIMLQDHQVPEHIKQTFHLRSEPNGTGRTWSTDIADYDIITIGQRYDLRTTAYLMIYPADEWHYEQVQHYEQQIKEQVPDALVALVPVVVDAEEEEPEEEGNSGGMSLQSVMRALNGIGIPPIAYPPYQIQIKP